MTSQVFNSISKDFTKHSLHYLRLNDLMTICIVFRERHIVVDIETRNSFSLIAIIFLHSSHFTSVHWEVTFVWFLSVKVACETKDLISQLSEMIIMIFLFNSLIFVKKNFRLTKCSIILLTFLRNRASSLWSVNFCDST